MSKVFFTSLDGEVWVNKNHLIEIINKDRKLKPLNKNKGVQRFADLLLGYLDTLYYKGDFNGQSKTK